MNTPFIHNDLLKDEYKNNSNTFNLRINSKDRNLQKERNPFNFRVRFHKHINNKSQLYSSPVINNSNEEQITLNNDGAVIDSNYENIRGFKVNEIIAPRYVPSDKVGLELQDITANSNNISSSSIYLYAYNQSKIEFKSLFTVAGNIIYYVKIITKKGEYYLLSETDLYNTFNTTVQGDRDDYVSMFSMLKDEYVTSQLLLNEKIYTITSITSDYLILNNNIDFMNTSIYLPDYYKDNIFSTTSTSDFTLNNTSIIIEDDNLINYNFTPGCYLNFNGSNFKISKITLTLDFGTGINIVKIYPNIHITDNDYQQLGLNRNSLPSYTTTLRFDGSWDFGTYAVGSSPYKFTLYERGFKDLIDEKVLYLSLGTINHSKNTNSNIDLNQTVCSFFPSTQSYDYVYLSGDFKFNFNYRDLRSIKNLEFKLYYKNGNIIGNEYNDIPIRVLNQDNKQLMINVFVQQVDKEF